MTALAFRDCENDGNAELLVGSEDFEIRIFQQEEVVHEATEADVVTGLTHLHKTFFGFSLASGAIGVYNNSNRVWHAKSKHKAVSISSFDLDADGVPELITGWSNGRVEVRKIDDGKLIYKDRFSNPIAHITVADYRMDKRDEIIACAVDGEIRGYLPAEEEKTEMEAAADLMDNNELEMQLKEVYEKKQALLKELKYYENNANKLKSGDMAAGVIPPDTKIELSIRPNKRTKSLTLSLNTNNNTVIKLIIAESDILFENATWVVHPDRPTNALSFPVQMEKYVTTEIKIKAVVGYTSSTQDHVFELTHTLPRFAPFILTRPRTMNVSLPTSSVVFNTSERVGRVKLWINESFNVDETTSKETLSITNDTLQATFLNIKSDLPLLIKVTPDNGGQVHVRCDDMELAGEIVQDMCRYLKIEHLESVADFPTEMKAFGDVLQKVEDHNTTRLRLSAEISHRANIIKNLVIRAEDARILNAARLMKDKYSELFDLNQELIGEYTKRANNHAELLKSLKEVNHMIQKAANLRMGQHKKKVVGSCRKAIKLNNIHALLKIIKVGHPGPGNM